MATDCIAQVTFNFDPKRKPVVARFDVPYASSDGGAILLKGIDTQLGLTRRLAACLEDPRQPGKIQHQIVGDELGQAESAQTTVRACRHSEHLPGEPLHLTRTLVLNAQPLELLGIQAHAGLLVKTGGGGQPHITQVSSESPRLGFGEQTARSPRSSR